MLPPPANWLRRSFWRESGCILSSTPITAHRHRF